jgi:hypothetical protein
VGRRQLSKAGFKTYLVDGINLSKLNSESTAALVADAIHNATHCGNLSPRMCNLQSDSGGLFDGRVRLHKTSVQAECPNQGYFHSSRIKIGQFDDSAKIVSRCPTFAVAWDCFWHRQHSRLIMVVVEILD